MFIFEQNYSVRYWNEKKVAAGTIPDGSLVPECSVSRTEMLEMPMPMPSYGREPIIFWKLLYDTSN
jgi:hypothetical protein